MSDSLSAGATAKRLDDECPKTGERHEWQEDGYKTYHCPDCDEWRQT